MELIQADLFEQWRASGGADHSVWEDIASQLYLLTTADKVLKRLENG